MATAHERYKNHAVWEPLEGMRKQLMEIKCENGDAEQLRKELIEYFGIALKTKSVRQPSFYLPVLDNLYNVVSNISASEESLKYCINEYQQSTLCSLHRCLRELPQAPPRSIPQDYIQALNEEVEIRNTDFAKLKELLAEVEDLLEQRHEQLNQLKYEIDRLSETIEEEKKSIIGVSRSAEKEMRSEWNKILDDWQKERKKLDADHDAEALKNIATLAATTKAGEALAEHAAGDLSAADWYGRAKRERRGARWMRAGALATFVFAGAVGFFIVSEAISQNFDISLGGGILRASIAVVIASFGALLIRESGRHFREADTAEDVALSLRALAPYYAKTGEEIRLAARVELGNAVLVKNVLSRFSHRDASKHAAEVNMDGLSDLVKEATDVLKPKNVVDGQGYR